MTTLDRPPEVDSAAVDAFADRMIQVLNNACTALMTSIGHQVGLFDAMVATGAATDKEIAVSAGLNERYVREWLGAMTTAGVVTHDARARTYTLPPEHAACLTSAGPDNLARLMTFMPMLAEVEQGIVDCFRSGGGLSYAHYPRFHALMAEDSAAVADATLVDAIVPLVPGLQQRLGAGIDAADIGCGSGHAMNVLGRTFPRSRFVGYDFSAEAIAAARDEAQAWRLDNVRFEELDVATLDVADRFDFVTAFDAIHDQAHPTTVLAAISRALRAGGTFLMVDIKASSKVEENLDIPWAPFLYTVSTMHCMTVSLGLDGDGLGTVWGEQLATSMLKDAGFGDVEIAGIEDDPLNSYFICRHAPDST